MSWISGTEEKRLRMEQKNAMQFAPYVRPSVLAGALAAVLFLLWVVMAGQITATEIESGVVWLYVPIVLAAGLWAGLAVLLLLAAVRQPDPSWRRASIALAVLGILLGIYFSLDSDLGPVAGSIAYASVAVVGLMMGVWLAQRLAQR
jgi:peptidoglycan/LPS O-acetylase OafA/YrhL